MASLGDPKAGKGGSTLSTVCQLQLFTHSPAPDGPRGVEAVCFPILFLFRFSALSQPDGNRLPVLDTGDGEPIAPRSPQSPQMQKAADSLQLCREEQGRREGSAVLTVPAAGLQEGSQGFSQEGGQGRTASNPGRPHLRAASSAALLPL